MASKVILIIEDSEYLAESLADLLNIHGHQTIIANNGLEGISLAADNRPDLILLDIGLPDIDGYDVFNQIRKNPWGKEIKILILTASESVDVISKNVDMTKENILFKPDWSMKDLMKKIDDVLSD